MTDDLEMVRLCAEAMGYRYTVRAPTAVVNEQWIDAFIDDRREHYNPIYDDEQAMALVKKLDINIDKRGGGVWVAWPAEARVYREVSLDLNRAIVGCVAKMQRAKA